MNAVPISCKNSFIKKHSFHIPYIAIICSNTLYILPLSNVQVCEWMIHAWVRLTLECPTDVTHQVPCQILPARVEKKRSTLVDQFKVHLPGKYFHLSRVYLRNFLRLSALLKWRRWVYVFIICEKYNGGLGKVILKMSTTQYI